ncbi:hypothetical protein Pelo_1086 [Pelomyxa schiedti]|nr:hypothetical protein Pelo_1086 [Pelomyxa schiedti]
MLLLLGRLTLVWVRAPFTPNWWTVVFALETVAIAAGDWALYVMATNDAAAALASSSSSGITIEHVDEVAARIWLGLNLVLSMISPITVCIWTVLTAVRHKLFIMDEMDLEVGKA